MFQLAALLTLLTVRYPFAADADMDVQLAQLEFTQNSMRAELFALSAGDIRELYVNQHASLSEFVTSLGRVDSAHVARDAAGSHVELLRTLQLASEGPTECCLVIPGFETHPALRRLSAVPVDSDESWALLASLQNFQRPDDTFLDSHGWKSQLQRLRDLVERPDPAELHKLQLQAQVADSTEVLHELRFRPVRMASESYLSQTRALSILRQQAVVEARASRARRIAKLATAKKDSAAPIVQTGFVRNVSASSTDLDVPVPPVTRQDLDDAVTAARERINRALANVKSKKRRLQLVQEGSGNTEKHRLQLKQAELALEATEHELELRRAEHLHLISRRNQLFSTDQRDYRDPDSVRKIFALRSEPTLVRLADVQTQLAQLRLDELQTLYDGGYVSWKELTDAKVAHGRSKWQTQLMDHKCNIYRRIADKL